VSITVIGLVNGSQRLRTLLCFLLLSDFQSAKTFRFSTRSN